MKPRIRKRFGIWCCVTFWPFSCGCGETPEEAFKEWEVICAERAEGVSA